MMSRFDLRKYILLIAGRMIKWSTVAAISQRAGWVRGSTPPIDPAQGEKNLTEPVRNIQHFGFRSVPTVGSELIEGAPRAGNQRVALGSDNLGCGPADLKEGEVAIYNSTYTQGAVCRIKLDEHGSILIDAKAGQNIILNGGTKENARKGDAVNMGTVIAHVTVMGAPVPVVFEYTPFGGSVGLPLTTLTLDGGEITSGEPHVKS